MKLFVADERRVWMNTASLSFGRQSMAAFDTGDLPQIAQDGRIQDKAAAAT